MPGDDLTRREAAAFAALGLASWVFILPWLCVAAFKAVTGDFAGAKKSLGTVGLSLAIPFIYGWIVIAGPKA